METRNPDVEHFTPLRLMPEDSWYTNDYGQQFRTGYDILHSSLQFPLIPRQPASWPRVADLAIGWLFRVSSRKQPQHLGFDPVSFLSRGSGAVDRPSLFTRISSALLAEHDSQCESLPAGFLERGDGIRTQ